MNFLNVIWTFVAGSNYALDDPKLHDLLALFNKRGAAFDLSGGILSQFPWIRFIAPEKSGYNLILAINDELKKIISNEIKRHKQAKTGETVDFIDVYLKEIELAGSNSEIFNEDQLIAICLDFFIAGLHTTSDTLIFALIAMIKFPDIQYEVQKNLDSFLPKEEIPTFDDRHKVPYVEAVLMESMRYLHVVPLLGPRRVLNDLIIDGYSIPKNSTIIGDLDGYYHDTERWGDPENFRPERFLDEQGILLNAERFLFFGSGARSCIGDVLAKQFIFTFFTGLLHRYQISLAPGASLPKPIVGITIKPEPLNVSLKPRI